MTPIVGHSHADAAATHYRGRQPRFALPVMSLREITGYEAEMPPTSCDFEVAKCLPILLCSFGNLLEVAEVAAVDGTFIVRSCASSSSSRSLVPRPLRPTNMTS